MDFQKARIKSLLLIFTLFVVISKSVGQSDQKNEFEFSVSGNFGGVVQLAKNVDGPIVMPTNISTYFGVLVNGTYGRVNVEIGAQKVNYAICLEVQDTVVGSTWQSCRLSSSWPCYRFPISVGYVIPLGKKERFSCTPYGSMGLSVFFAKSDAFSFYSESESLSPEGSSSSKFTNGFEINKKAIFFSGIGTKFNYRYKKLSVALNLEYFQSFNEWITLYGLYQRSSDTYGSLTISDSFSEVEKNFIAGISIGMFF